MKLELRENRKNISESVTAIFMIAMGLFFVAANYFIGFNLLVFVLTAILVFGLSVFYPRSGVYAVVFLTAVFERFFTLVPAYWNRAEYKIYPLDIFLAGILIGAFAKVFFSGKKRMRFKPVDGLVAFFILASTAYFAASILLSGSDFSVAFSTFKNYAFYGLFYFAIRLLFRDKKDLVKLLKFLLAGAAAIVIFILIGIFRGEGLWTEFTPLSTPGTRILAFPHAFYLSMAVLAALSWIAFRKDKLSDFLKIAIPIWMVGIVGSLMRHLWISLFVSFFVLYIFLSEENRKRMKKLMIHYFFIGLVLLILISYFSFLFPNSPSAKLFSSALNVTGTRFVSTAQVSSDESLNWRKSVWQSTWQEYKHNLLFGLGYGKKVSVEIGTKYKDFVEIRNIHNSLLTIFIQMGLWSVVLFATIFWFLVKPFLKGRKTAASPSDSQFLKTVFLALFANYLIAFLFQTYLETNLLGIFFWIILGGLAVLAENREVDENSQ